MKMKKGGFCVLMAGEMKIEKKEDNSWEKLSDNVGEHCWFLHEEHVNEKKSIKDLSWTSFWVGGRMASAILDFVSFFTGEKQFCKKSNYKTWIYNPITSAEQCLVSQHLPELWPKLEELLQKKTGSTLADLMLESILDFCNVESF
jgi:hypothetical protein